MPKLPVGPVQSVGPYKYDDDEDYVPTQKVKYSTKDDGSIHLKKHTLDSDEEDEDTRGDKKKYDVLHDEDIDGQEAATIDHEGEVQITPFNMKEELEDGHFDRDGFYHFKKDRNELKDAWLEDIDWVKIKHQEDAPNKYGSDDESEDDKDDEITFKPEAASSKELYKDIFSYLNPHETISKAMKRLGGNKKRLTTAERWKLKKLGKLNETSQDMEAFMKLTDFVNQMVACGNMDIYEETYEIINLKIQRWNASSAAPSMDMFSNAAEGVEPPSKKVKFSDERNSKESEEKPLAPPSSVQWEYKWDEEEMSDIHGPFSTEQMIEWQDSEFFKGGTFVRKVEEKPGSWYNSKRIDFDLFT